MLELLICCSPADREAAAEIGTRLERGAELRVLVDDSEGESVAAKWEQGRDSAAVLLLLSPESVPERVSRVEWGPLLDHVASRSEPPVGIVLLRECGYPRILERGNFFRWEEGRLKTLRAVERWGLELHPDVDVRPFTPARLPWFEGREEERGALWESLVDGAGTAVLLNEEPASGKTALAQEFCREAGAHFRLVLWADCGERSPAAIAADLAEQMGVGYAVGQEEAFGRVLELIGRHRVLVVLDDFPGDIAIPAGLEGGASVLVTARSAEVPPGVRAMRIKAGSYSAPAAPDNEIDRRLLRAMAVCRRGGFAFDVAVRVAGIEAAAARASRARLVEGRLADPLDDARGWLRLSARFQEFRNAYDGPLPDGRGSETTVEAADTQADLRNQAPSLEAERRRHAELIQEELAAWASNQGFDRRYSGEIMPAFRWAAGADWPLACSLVKQAFKWLRHHNRIAEGIELLEGLREVASLRGDPTVADECSWELLWLRGEPYRGLGRAPVSGDQLGFDFDG